MDILSGLGDILGSVFGGGSTGGSTGGSGLGNFLAALGTAGIGAYGDYANTQATLDATNAQNAFTAGENQKDRDAAMAQLMARLAQGGGGGGGGGSAAAMANVKRQQALDLANTILQGAQLRQGAMNDFLGNIRGPYQGLR